MLIPIKIKNPFKEVYILKNLLSSDNEKRLNALNFIRVGKTFKTTKVARFPASVDYLKNLNKKFNFIHDIGCSDGSSALHVIDHLEFNRYYCLDKHIEMQLEVCKGSYFLCDKDKNIHMYENKWFLIYLDPFKTQSSFLENIFSVFFSRLSGRGLLKSNVSFINTDLKDLEKVIFQEFDIFRDRLKVKSNLIIVFNLLDKFKEHKDFSMIRSFFCKSLAKDGLLVIGENKKQERASIYQKREKDIERIHCINGGSFIKEFL